MKTLIHCILILSLSFGLVSCDKMKQKAKDTKEKAKKDAKKSKDKAKKDAKKEAIKKVNKELQKPKLQKLAVEKIDAGTNSGYQEAGEHVITTQEKWQEVWAKVYETVQPKPELPAVDFAKETVIAVFMGQKNSGGYTIEVTEAMATGNNMQVMVKENSPEGGDMGMGIAALTQPYYLGKVATTGKKVSFKK